MKKFFFIATLMMVNIIFSQTNKIIGNWLMEKIEVNGKIHEPFNTLSFNSNGKMKTRGLEFGTWKYNVDNNEIILNSRFGKKFTGEAKILTLTNNNFVFQNGKAKYYLVRLNENQIRIDNKNSGLKGIWQYEYDGLHTYLKFTLPDSFLSVTTGDGSIEIKNGSWIYSPKKSELIITAISTPLHGKNIVKINNGNRFVIETMKGTITAQKLGALPIIERLTFTENDFPEECDDTQLPWKDLSEMADLLSPLKYLKYRSGVLIPKINILEYSEVIKKIIVDTDKPSIRFVNLEVNGTDTTQYSENYKGELSEKYNLFFPLNDFYPFKIIGHQKIKVGAGQFNCTVVEAFDGEDKYKLWMIDSLPGVYAKIIQDSESSFGNQYNVMELDEIKR